MTYSVLGGFALRKAEETLPELSDLLNEELYLKVGCQEEVEHFGEISASREPNPEREDLDKQLSSFYEALKGAHGYIGQFVKREECELEYRIIIGVAAATSGDSSLLERAKYHHFVLRDAQMDSNGGTSLSGIAHRYDLVTTNLDPEGYEVKLDLGNPVTVPMDGMTSLVKKSSDDK